MQNLVSLGLMARYREIWQFFPYISPYETCDPRGGAKFHPYNLGTLNRGLLDKTTCKI